MYNNIHCIPLTPLLFSCPHLVHQANVSPAFKIHQNLTTFHDLLYHAGPDQLHPLPSLLLGLPRGNWSNPFKTVKSRYPSALASPSTENKVPHCSRCLQGPPQPTAPVTSVTPPLSLLPSHTDLSVQFSRLPWPAYPLS